MLSTLLIVLAAIPIFVTPFGRDCHVWPNTKGDLALRACSSNNEMRLTFLTVHGKTTEVTLDADMSRSAVPTGPAAWAPTDTHVAVEIGLDEEPGVLLIDVSEKPSTVFVDRALISANVSGAGPQWDASGSWLVFRTSGTGEWDNEGIYAREIKSGAILKLLAGVPRSMAVSGDSLFVTLVKKEDRTKAELLVFKLSALLKEGDRIDSQSFVRSRPGKE